MKAVVAAFNQEKALVGAFSVITNLRMELFEALVQTFLGKMFGGLCAIVGVFTLTLPIPIVVNSFAGFYKNRLWRNEVAQKKRLRVEESRRRSKAGLDTLEVTQAGTGALLSLSW